MDMIALIEKNLGKKADFKFLPMQPGDVPESFADIKRSYEKLGYTPKTSIEIGIPKLIKWYKGYKK